MYRLLNFAQKQPDLFSGRLILFVFSSATSQCGFSDNSDNLAGFEDWPGWSPGISYTSGTVGVGGTFCDPLENLEMPDIYFSLDERELLFDAIAPT